MNWKGIGYLFGALLMAFSLAMLPPLAAGWYYGDGAIPAFLDAFLLTLGAGGILWLTCRRSPRHFTNRDGFLLVAAFWVVLGLFGALPLILSGTAESFTAAFFEAVSGLTTTGSTVLSGLAKLPHAILIWRQEMQWLGGMGIIVLGLAVLPILGIGGMQLYQAEIPGPVKNQKLTPRIADTARALWLIYVGLTVAGAIALWAAGMAWFDAVSHAFTAVSTGGFSPYDGSVGHFSAPLIHYILVALMFLGGVNFALHFGFLRGRGLKDYLGDTEFRALLGLHLGAVGLVTAFLLAYQSYPSWEESFRMALFQVVSIGTTTGFATADYEAWPSLLPFFILLVGFFLGSAGSTSGGIKVIRLLILWKEGVRQAYMLIHPRAVRPLRLGDRPVPLGVTEAVWGFFAVYVSTFAILVMVMLALEGGDLLTAVGSVGATLTCVGPGLGDVGPADNFASISVAGKWVLILAMLLGRLELFTLFVLLLPAFWRP